MPILARGDNKTWVEAAVVVGAVVVLYFFTAARDIVVGDTPELITAAVTLGVPHPPGYPLFTMLGHLFSLLPFGPVPFRVNLLAVTCDALTVAVIFFTALRLSQSRPAAAIAALTLAVIPAFWTWSLVAEVFPLNNLLASVLIYLLVTWHQEPHWPGVLIAAFFVAGLALTNHHTIVLLAPAFCFVFWQHRAPTSFRNLHRSLLHRTVTVRLCALGLRASSRLQLGQRLVTARSDCSHRPKELRKPPAGWYGQLHGRFAIRENHRALHFFRAGRGNVDLIGSSPGLSASTLVFLVQSYRLPLRRAVVRLDHQSKHRHRAIRVVRVAAVFSPAPSRRRTLDRIRRFVNRRSHRVFCAGAADPALAAAGRIAPHCPDCERGHKLSPRRSKS